MVLLFTPPSDDRTPSVPAGQARRLSSDPAVRLMRHFRGPSRGVNVWIVGGVATEVQPMRVADASATFYGGHGPYEVTEAQQVVLEAAGYEVVDSGG